MCAKVVHNWSSWMASFQFFGICDPLTPFKCPLGLEGLISLAYFHSLMNLHSVSNLVPIGPVVWKLSQIYELMTPSPMLVGYRGVNF